MRIPDDPLALDPLSPIGHTAIRHIETTTDPMALDPLSPVPGDETGPREVRSEDWPSQPATA